MQLSLAELADHSTLTALVSCPYTVWAVAMLAFLPYRHTGKQTMKNLRAIGAGFFSLLICISAQAQSKSGWTDHNCKKDPFTSQVNCSMVVLESLPAKSGSVPGALFAWIMSKEKGRILIPYDRPCRCRESPLRGSDRCH